MTLTKEFLVNGCFNYFLVGSEYLKSHVATISVSISLNPFIDFLLKYSVSVDKLSCIHCEINFLIINYFK